MKDVALFLAGAGASLAACLYVLAVRREGERPFQPSNWGDDEIASDQFPVFHERGNTL